MSDRLGSQAGGARYSAFHAVWTKWNPIYYARHGFRTRALDAIWGSARPPVAEMALADVADMLGASLRASLRIVDPSGPM